MQEFQNTAQQQPRPEDLARGGLRTFFNIMGAWDVSDDIAMRILGATRSTYYRWRVHPETARLSNDTLERLSYIFGIYKGLKILLPDRTAANTWVMRPNQSSLFNGESPMNRLQAGRVSDLFVVHQFLDAQRGGWA